MSFKQNYQLLIDKMVGLINNIFDGRGLSPSHQNPDALYVEIYQLQETLSKASSHSSQGFHHQSLALEPVTEQQKIMDMSG